MAILKGFTASIIVDGKVCHEYHDESNDEIDRARDEGSPQISNYIEAIPGAEFTVKVEIPTGLELGNTESLACRAHLDGKWVRVKVKRYNKYRLQAYNDLFTLSDSLVSDGSSFRKFKFTNMIAGE
jgi:hypothetical protein